VNAEGGTVPRGKPDALRYPCALRLKSYNFKMLKAVLDAAEVAMLDNERDESSGGYGTAADVWGMGAVLFVMLSCTLLFDEPDDVIETRLR